MVKILANLQITLVIPRVGSGQDKKYINDTNMSLDMNMLLMYHVHDLSTEMEIKNYNSA